MAFTVVLAVRDGDEVRPIFHNQWRIAVTADSPQQRPGEWLLLPDAPHVEYGPESWLDGLPIDISPTQLEDALSGPTARFLARRRASRRDREHLARATMKP